MPHDPIVIVGAGQCGGQCADALLRAGHTGHLVLIGDERQPPYQRPPLSKQLLAGTMPPERAFLKPAGYWSEKGVELVLGRRAVSIDRAARTVTLDDGARHAYEALVLATGSRPRHLGLPGEDLAGVHDLRTMDDAEGIRRDLRDGARLVVVGGGFIGLEVAAVARGMGARVTVLEAADRLLARVMPAAMSSWFRRLHERHGVTVHTGVSVEGFDGTAGHVSGVRTESATHPADLVVMGVGIVPNQELAAQCGLACDDGIVVDERGATSDPAIFAAGDCTRHPNALLGANLRLESVHNATAQARTVAANLLGGQAHYAEMPWFWSDQYDVKLQMIGLSADHDQTVVRGDIDAGAFVVFYLRHGVPIAADAINSPRDFMVCRKLVPRLEPVDTARLGDPDVPLKDLA
jgi:3-phenylpropionate/trans-cinnamate dioxygenase ferredoxin reductase subunit